MIFVLILFLLLLVAGAHAEDYRLRSSIDFGDWRNFIPSLIRVRDEILNLQLSVRPGEHRFIVGVNIPTDSIFTPTQTSVYMALAYQRRAAINDEKNDEKDEKQSGIGNFYITQIGTSPNLPVVTRKSVKDKSGFKKADLDFSLANVNSARRELRGSTLRDTWYDVVDSNFAIISYDGRSFVFNAADQLTFTRLIRVFSPRDIQGNWAERQQSIEYFALVFAESLRNHQVADAIVQYLRDVEENGYSTLDLTPHQRRITSWDASALRFFNAFKGAYSGTPELFVMQNLPRRSATDEAINVEQCLSWHYWTILDANGTTRAPPVTPPTGFSSSPCGFLARCTAADQKEMCRMNEINPKVTDLNVVDLLLSYVYFDTSNTRQGVDNNAYNAIALLSSSVINTMMVWIRERANGNRRSGGGGGKKKGLSHAMQILSQTPSPIVWSSPVWSTAYCYTRNRDLSWSKRYAADVNGDGRMDVVFNSWQMNQCSDGGVLLSSGDGTFQDVWCFPFSANAWNTALFIGDVNGDGKSDLILQRDSAHESCTLPSAWSVYLGQSNGTFSSTSNCDRVVNPADGDNLGTFNRGAAIVTVIDMNNDGQDDLLFHTNGQNQCGTVLISYSNQLDAQGGPVFFHGELQCIARFAGSSTQMKVTPMDVNGDGVTDLFFQVSTNYVEGPCPAGKGGVYLGEVDDGIGKSNFNTLVCMDWNMDPESVKITPLDVNSDGKSDLLIQIKPSSTTVSQCPPGQGGIYLASNSTRIFGTPVRCIPVGLGSDQVTVHIGDVNGDGWQDLVLQTQVSYPLHYTLPECDPQHQGLMTMYGYGNGTFIQRDCKKYRFNAQWAEGDVLLGDVNRDGRDDIVFRDGPDDCPDYIQRASGSHGLGVLLSTPGSDEQLN